MPLVLLHLMNSQMISPHNVLILLIIVIYLIIYFGAVMMLDVLQVVNLPSHIQLHQLQLLTHGQIKFLLIQQILLMLEFTLAKYKAKVQI